MKLRQVWISICTVLSILVCVSPVMRNSLSSAIAAVPKPIAMGFNSITGAESREIVEFLAGPNTRGRSIDAPGFAVAAGYVAHQLQKMGLKPMGDDGSYFQRIPLKAERRTNETAYVTTSDRSFRANLGESLQVNYTPSDRINITASPVFITINPKNTRLPKGFKTSDLEGKILFVEDRRNPLEAPNPKLIETLKALAPAKIVAQFIAMEGFAEILRKADKSPVWAFSFADNALNAATLPVAQSDSKSGETFVSGIIDKTTMQEFAKRAGAELPQVSDSEEIAVSFGQSNLALSIDRTQKEQYEFESMNVVALLEGSDPSLKLQAVGIGAHLDHLGAIGGKIYPGADDNASGIAAVLEIAQALQQNSTRPKRSVLFLLFAGEERQLLGSRYYAEKPVFPHKQMVAFLNLDSISRNHGDKPGLGKVVYQDGASCWAKLNATIQNAARMVELTVEPIFKAEGLQAFDTGCDNLKAGVGSPSDHVSFAKKGIPVTLFTTGIHADYHEPTDTIDKVNFDKLTRVAKLVYLTVEQLAN